jgi:hypothetical protein
VLLKAVRKADQKYLESFEIMAVEKDGEYIRRSDHVRNEEVLGRAKEESNILHAIQRRKATWIGHSLSRNCRLIHFIERYKGQEDEEEEVSGY